MIVSATIGLHPDQSEAVTSVKVGYVSIDSGVLNVRSGPGTNYKVIGSLKNNVSVSVYSQSKLGWSQIGFKGKRDYVSSKYLRMYSYLIDKKKVYTYKANGETFKSTYVGKYNGGMSSKKHLPAAPIFYTRTTKDFISAGGSLSTTQKFPIQLKQEKA